MIVKWVRIFFKDTSYQPKTYAEGEDDVECIHLFDTSVDITREDVVNVMYPMDGIFKVEYVEN